jgi:ABC-2 type transport system permease protein
MAPLRGLGSARESENALMRRGLIRYLKLWLALGRYGLIRELAFRGNFLVKMSVEVLWLGILLIFYQTVFTQTTVVAGWTEAEYLFYVGCHFALLGVIETFFLENCGAFADLVRTGDLDHYLLQPIDEQFLVTCRTIDWAAASNIFMGAGVMVFGLVRMPWTVDVGKMLLFVVLFGCGVAIAYSFLLMLTASSVWLMRNQSLYEIWWLFTTLMRYPREIYVGWAAPIGWFFTLAVPIMLVTNVPAHTMVKAIDPLFVGLTFLAAAVLLLLSRKVFRSALRRYRSASS